MFDRIYDAKATLSELERGCETTQKMKRANLTSIEGRNAELPDKTKINVNVGHFDPKPNPSDVHDDITMVKKADATVTFRAQMAAEGRTQVGGDMNVFVESQPETILIFGKTT
jgi:hypothetical protein